MKKQNPFESLDSSIENVFNPKYQENPELVRCENLLNFFAYFPGGQYRGPLYFTESNETQRSRLIQGFKAEKIKKTDEEIENILSTNHSEKYLDQTTKQFFETIDEAIKECRISDSDIEKIVSQRGLPKEPELQEKILSVYKKLLSLGYKRIELIQ